LRYLLISGQAAILYGASQFSEDVDIWIRPDAANARRLLLALADSDARVHKLTPRLDPSTMRAGHGFHFVVPGKPQELYLDVMAVPPRVGPFDLAATRATTMESEFGRVPVVSVEDLILLKQTRRAGDYDVISSLVRLRVGMAPTRGMLRWAARETFDPEQQVRYLAALGRPANETVCRRQILKRMTLLQERDTRYWRRRVGALRRLRRSGGLLPEGQPVRPPAAR
jgi:hypothetical protein